MSEAVLSLARRLLHDQGGETAALRHLERSTDDETIRTDANVWAAIGYLRKSLGDLSGAEHAYNNAATLKRASLLSQPQSIQHSAVPQKIPSTTLVAHHVVDVPVEQVAQRAATTAAERRGTAFNRLSALRTRTAELLHIRDASRKRSTPETVRRTRREGRFNALFSRTRMLSRQTANLLDAASRTNTIGHVPNTQVGAAKQCDDDSSSSTSVHDAVSDDESESRVDAADDYDDEYGDRDAYGSDDFYDGIYDGVDEFEVESDDVGPCSDEDCELGYTKGSYESSEDEYDVQVLRNGVQPAVIEWVGRWHGDLLSGSERSGELGSDSELESMCGADSELYCGALCENDCACVECVEHSFENSTDDESDEDLSFICDGLDNLEMIVWHTANLSSGDEHVDGEAIEMSDTLSQFMAEDEWSVAEEGEDHMWLDEWDRAGRGVEDIERIAPAKAWHGSKVICVICTEEIHGSDAEVEAGTGKKEEEGKKSRIKCKASRGTVVRTLPCSNVLEKREVNNTLAGHTFHADCIDKWLQKNHTCPTCRSHIGV